MFVLSFFFFGFYGIYAQDTHTDIVPNGAVVKKLSADQFMFNEGPVWFNDSVLLFVDDGLPGIGSDIYQYEPNTKQFSKWPTNSSHCTGLTCDKYGNLIGASFNILMIDKAGQLVKTLASGYNGKPFDNPNDIIADDKGGIYFTDPDFFLTTPPQDKTAVYYIDSIGNVKRVIDDIPKPNGLVLSPDGKKLYVGDTENKYLYSRDVATDGSLSGKLILAELATRDGINIYTDGMAIDRYGNIYVATGMGIQVVSPQGVHITTIVVPESPSNCDFGGKDFKTLFITAGKNLYSIDLNYPGYAVSRKNISNAVNPFSNNLTVNIYPNQVQNVLHINLPGKAGRIEIFDITGKSVLLKPIHENNPSFDVSLLRHGIYFVKVFSDNQLVTRKFVKH